MIDDVLDDLNLIRERLNAIPRDRDLDDSVARADRAARSRELLFCSDELARVSTVVREVYWEWKGVVL